MDYTGFVVILGLLYGLVFKGSLGMKCLECVGHATLSGNCTDSTTCHGDQCFTTYIHGGKSGSEFVHKGCVIAGELEKKSANDSCVKILEYGIIDQFTCMCQSRDFCNQDFADQVSETGKTAIEADVKCFDCHDSEFCDSGSCIGKWCVAGVIQTDSKKESVQKTCSLDSLPGSVANGCVKVSGKHQYLCTCNTTFCNSDTWLKEQLKNAIDVAVLTSQPETNRILDDGRIFGLKELDSPSDKVINQRKNISKTSNRSPTANMISQCFFLCVTCSVLWLFM